MAEQGEQLDNRKILPLLVLLFSDSFAFTNIFSYITFMVQDFGIEATHVGYQSGWLASAHYFSQFCTCFLWGRMSDRYGRKPFLLLGVLGTFCSMMCLGVATTFWQALLARIIGGLFNSNLPIAKSYLADVCDPKNRASALSKTTLMFGLGQIVGPFYAGLVSQLATKYPAYFGDTFLAHYPYLVPCWTAALLSCSAFAYALLGMPESKSPVVPHNQQSITITGSDDEEQAEEAAAEVAKQEAEKSKSPYSRAVIFMMIMFSGAASINIGYSEVFPAWSMLSPAQHGISFTSSDIGLTWGVSGLALVVFQTLFFARLANRYGCMRCCQIGMSCWFLICTYPLLQYLNPVGRPAIWTGVIVLTLIRSVGVALTMPALNLGVNLASPPDKVGQVNGLNSTIAAFSRGMFPFLITNILAWSLQNEMSFPLNEFLVFVLCSLFAVGTFTLTFFVPNLGVIKT